jgi:hypothetical protein
MYNSLRDILESEITALPDNTEINATLVGRLYTGCASVEVPNGVLTTFTFTLPDGVTPATLASEFSELVKVNQATKIRTTHYVFTPATCTAIFTGGNIPAGGEVVTLDFIKTITL